MGPGGVSRRETWEYIVWRKADRFGCEISKEFYAMNFRHKESEDHKTALLKEMVIDFSSTSIVDEEIVVGIGKVHVRMIARLSRKG